jgi:glutamate/tyrosine decarboxylase-like PLP-dependent enzyme
MKHLLHDAAERAIRYREGLDGRSVIPSDAAVSALAALDGPMPEHSTDPTEVLALLDDVGSPATLTSAGGRYFGFVIGSSLPVTVAANWLATAWDQNTALRVMSPVAVGLEEIALRWMAEALGLPEGCGGALVTGCQMANFAGLAAARHALLEREGWNVERDGLFGAPPFTVVVGDEVHATLLKALAMLGLGHNRVVRVPTDGQGSMRADAFPKLSGPTLVCLQAGNVNTGAFDPAEEICARARDAGAWVHIDGAFGLWAAVAPARAHLTAGCADADSWATDAHKWLNVPYDCGVAFVRDPAALRGAMSIEAAYLLAGAAREPMQNRPDSSLRARGVEVWAALKALGRSGLADLVERTCRHATRFAEGFRAAGYEVLNDVIVNQVLVSFGDDEATRRTIAAVQRDGTCWCGGTHWHGRAAMRVSVSSYATTEADVDRCLEAIIRAARGGE